MSSKLVHRVIVVVVVAVVALITQTVVLAHLEGSGDNPPGKLTKALKDFPKELGGGRWRQVGKDEKLDETVDTVYVHPLEHLQRVYQNVETGQHLQVWVVYSEVGEDRGHHPEVCYPVAGYHEVEGGRALVEVPGQKSPVQQLRYGDENDTRLVYYWHYTLPSQQAAELDGFQKTFQKLRRREASVTLQVTAPDTMMPDAASGAIDFVRLCDAAFQSYLGPDAVRGCQRLPVSLN